jgi:ribosome-binding protein aMBF1 (putative translation factor)
MTLIAAQCRTARQLLGWSLEELAHKVRLSELDIARFEAGKTAMSFIGIAIIQRAFEIAGTEFVPGEPGVRLGREQ